MASQSHLLLLPGDPISYPHQQPSHPATTTKLSSGLRTLQTPSSNKNSTALITATQAGLLTTDPKRNVLTLHTFPQRRYIPSPNDFLIAQIHHSSVDYFHCNITPHTPYALLGQLAFEGATRKTRPLLKHGDLVYARVLSTGVGNAGEVELTCVNPATGKAEPGGLGPLAGGMVFDISTGLAERLSLRGGSEGVSGVVVLEELGSRLEGHGGFEIAVGRNGKVWVDCPVARKGGGGDVDAAKAVKTIVAVGRCLRETDEKRLGTSEQRKLVGVVLREMGL
ncbi:exosome complex exonuclease RRP40 [Histoplasma capsulatum]|uniref:Exosome complex exonuclease RRP40 n=1 Tax=Ajellomyces capsulatus TaxID=5037 RepID=A0A8A1MH80_AJECA|nr:conserved hypothetical protein [Histoplasma mississippiense (nom. inval.)]EDN08888.1 conserved hypothetical protein [Histoplasma mississippiense (nom. inval.)]QSS63487.1 exosome complex exonuclease RRP40 [Histoplasma capsulatum]